MQWNFSPNFLKYVSNARGSVRGFNDGDKHGRCACPDVAGIQLELEELARLLELLWVALTAKTPYTHAKRPVERGSWTAAAIYELRPH